MTGSAISERTGGKPRRVLRRLGKLALPIILVALALVLVRRFVGDVYLVREQSMSPGLRGGHDRLFVLHRPDVPGEDDRFDRYVCSSNS